MTDTSIPEGFMHEFHVIMNVLRNIDVGLVVLDTELNIKLWNTFMQNHSAKPTEEVLNRNLFEVFPELPRNWFERKLQTVKVLNTAAFTTWEQRPYLFKFKNYRPVTGRAEYMYQNCTIFPLTSTTTEVSQLCMIIYDVTEIAVNRLQLQEANAQLHTISRTDGLTGLLNRKTWERELNQSFKRFQRHEHESSLIMFDIDHFKRINDTYGHPAGDEVIRQTAEIFLDSIRDIDVAGRYGGEEFAVILTDTGAQAAKKVAERLRLAIEHRAATYENHVIHYTVSLGISELCSRMSDPTMWIDAADRGLYRAKRAGRNASVIYELD